MLFDVLVFLAPEFATEDFSLQEGIDALGADKDGGRRHLGVGSLVSVRLLFRWTD
jgi:hypothetical protein